MAKNIICIVGTSTAGKTSLLELLSNKDLFDDNVTYITPNNL
jgi:ABC-type phosphate/phosphonate transport system ATPase subunit